MICCWLNGLNVNFIILFFFIYNVLFCLSIKYLFLRNWTISPSNLHRGPTHCIMTHVLDHFLSRPDMWWCIHGTTITVTTTTWKAFAAITTTPSTTVSTTTTQTCSCGITTHSWYGNYILTCTINIYIYSIFSRTAHKACWPPCRSDLRDWPQGQWPWWITLIPLVVNPVVRPAWSVFCRG